MDFSTRLVRFDAAPGDPYQPTSTPIYQTATFEQSSALTFGQYDYTRSGNPTRAVLEQQLARLESGHRGFALSSGMAALATVVNLLECGDAVIAGDDLYGGTYRLLSRIVARRGVTVISVDPSDLAAMKRALGGQASVRLVLIETPTNPLQRIVDVPAIAALCQGAGALLAVDNTMLSPYFQRPLELGADIVIHSATKSLCGHGDVTAGAIITSNPELSERIAFFQNAEGNGLAPFECWLLLRGMKTLGVRLDRQQQSALQIARYLQRHELVKAVYFPGLADHPGHEIHNRQSTGHGCLISFETGDLELSQRLVEQTRFFTIAVSFGSIASTISLPCCMSHASIPGTVRRHRSFPEDLVRISVGLEKVDDLIADLDQVFESKKLASGSQGRAPVRV
jgi:cysteine-S-conjugate beta-lyase